MQDRDEIMTALTEMVKKALVKKNVEFGPEDNLQTQAGLDSMGANEIATMLEETYDIQFSDDDMKEIKTLNAIADLVQRKLAG
jgi:acyl carrier protein